MSLHRTNEIRLHLLSYSNSLQIANPRSRGSSQIPKVFNKSAQPLNH